MMRWLLRIVRRVAPDNVHLASEDGTADGHGDSDNGNIHARKIQTPDVNVFSVENVPPQETSQRRAEGRTECAIVNA